MNMMKPHVTGIALGVAVAGWIATRGIEGLLARATNGVCLGIGVAALATHLLQRSDESQASRRSYRKAKTAWLEAMACSIASQRSPAVDAGPAETAGGEAANWLSIAAESPVHMSETAFDEQPAALSSVEPEPVAAGPEAAFESAMAKAEWHEAFEALQAAIDADMPVEAAPADLWRLRQASMEEIFQRMHSGTVREDVARLAQAVIKAFPDTTEGKTLAQVIGVLRRSAGLCPRCAEPYRGIAAACHDCLRGTPESYQIAWDDDQESPQPPPK